jgi:hypothetical protein
MTDPLSISAAAVGFVSLALQVAQTTTQFVQDAKSFPEEFKKLSLAINEFGVLVRRLTPVIEKVEARYEIEGINDCVSPYCPLRANNWAWQARIRFPSHSELVGPF